MTTSEKILEYIDKKGQVTSREVSDFFPSVTSRAIRKQLKKMYDKGILGRNGEPPIVYYFIKGHEPEKSEAHNSPHVEVSKASVVEVKPIVEETKQIPNEVKPSEDAPPPIITQTHESKSGWDNLIKNLKRLYPHH